VLDWSAVTWAAGSLSNSFDVDPASPGNDITVTFTGQTGRFTNDPTTGIQTPAIDSTMEGGTSPVQPSLDMSMGLTTNKSITVTISFSAAYLQGVAGVSLSIFGINQGTTNDTLTSITGLSIDGVTLVAPTIINVGPVVQLSGSGLSQTLTGIGDSPHGGPGSGDGNATITFDSAIRSLTFTFQYGDTGFGNSQIAISNITFLPVPEFKAGWIPGAICLLASAQALYRRRQRARS
jgi:hypothetical protein